MGSGRQALILKFSPGRVFALLAASFSFSIFAKEEKPLLADLIAKPLPEDWRPVDYENTLYMEFAGKRVIIELAPEYAPKSVVNVKALAREKYWDGLAIVRVQDNYVVQWADPNAEKPELKKKSSVEAKLKNEMDIAIDKKVSFSKLPDKDTYGVETGFSKGFAAARDGKRMWLAHCYGAVGIGRDNDVDSGNGTELYAVIGQAPRHLDRNVTVIGRVVYGMENLSSLPRGHGNMGFYEKEPSVPISSIRLAKDVPDKDRLNLEVLRTDTKLFKKIIEARRNRFEPWFAKPAGHIDVCNFAIPVREKK